MAVAVPPPSARPLVVTADDHLLDELIRVATMCGLALDVAPDVGAARQTWPRASLVLVGAELVGSMLRSAPPRRAGLVVVGRGEKELDWPGVVRLGVDEVVLLPEQESRLFELLGNTTDSGGGGAVVVGVIGGRGGSGASVLAAALALAAVKLGLRCVLIDGDRLGGGLDAILGADEAEGARWPDLVQAEGRVSAAVLQSVLPNVGGVYLLSWDRGDLHPLPPGAMHAVLGSACRLAELVVVDLPRHLDEATEVALGLCTVTLLVVPAEVRAITAAARVASAIGAYTVDVRVVLRGHARSPITAAAVSELLGLPLAGELTSERGLTTALDEGRLPARGSRSPLSRWCREFLGGLDVSHREAA